MYRTQHNGQLSIDEFHLPFGGSLDPANRWLLLSALMPWEELEESHAPQFSPTVGAPAKPVRLAFGTLFIKQPRPGPPDEETVHQIRENASMQFSLGFAGYSSKAITAATTDLDGRVSSPSATVCTATAAFTLRPPLWCTKPSALVSICASAPGTHT